MLGQAVRVGAVEGLCSLFIPDLGSSSAYRAHRRDLDITASCEIACELRDYHVGLVYLDYVSDAKFKVYGQDDPELTYSLKGLVDSDSITGSLRQEGAA